MFSYRMGSLRHFNSLTLTLQHRVKHYITQLKPCKMSVECRSVLSMNSNSVLTDADGPVSESLDGAANTVKHLLQRLTARTSSANTEQHLTHEH